MEETDMKHTNTEARKVPAIPICTVAGCGLAAEGSYHLKLYCGAHLMQALMGVLQ